MRVGRLTRVRSPPRNSPRSTIPARARIEPSTMTAIARPMRRFAASTIVRSSTSERRSAPAWNGSGPMRAAPPPSSSDGACAASALTRRQRSRARAQPVEVQQRLLAEAAQRERGGGPCPRRHGQPGDRRPTLADHDDPGSALALLGGGRCMRRVDRGCRHHPRDRVVREHAQRDAAARRGAGDVSEDGKRGQRLQAAERVGRARDSGAAERDHRVGPRLGGQRHRAADAGETGGVRRDPAADRPGHELEQHEHHAEHDEGRTDLESERRCPEDLADEAARSPSSSAGLGIALLGIVELGMSRCMPSPSSSSRLTSSSVRPPTARSSGVERRSRVGEQRRERQVRVEEQPGRSSQAPAPQLVRDPSRGIAAHVTCARRVASAAVTASVSAALAVAMTTDSGSWRSSRRAVSSSMSTSAASDGANDAVLDADERDGQAAQLERLRERERGADRRGEPLAIRDPVVADADGVDDVRGGQRACLGRDGGPGARPGPGRPRRARSGRRRGASPTRRRRRS